MVNLCVDRYAFAVGLGAALLRELPSLLPPDARRDTLDRLREGRPDVFAVADDRRLDVHGIPLLWIDPAAHATIDPAAAVPELVSRMHAVSLLTSGSTGVPQPHAKTWHTLVHDVAAACRGWPSLLDLPSLDGLSLVTTVPVQHSYGLESSVLLALQGGASFECGRPFFPADVAAALASVPRPRALVTTPFHLKNLLRAGIELPSVDLILSATAPLSPQLATQAEQAMGAVLIEIYGSTESGQVASRRTSASEVWQAFGAIEVHAEQDASGDERFVFSGDFIPEPTPMADVLELIDAQHFRLFGRANDLIHVAGRRSSLGYLNFHLNSVPGVLDGAFWLPDDVTDGVVRPIAFVVAPGLDAHDVIAALRQRLEPVFVPRRVVHVASLPHESTGKLTVRAMREFALAQTAVDGTLVQVTREVPVDHPAFAGHFPGQPLMPGALLLAEVLEAVRGVPALAARLGAASDAGGGQVPGTGPPGQHAAHRIAARGRRRARRALRGALRRRWPPTAAVPSWTRGARVRAHGAPSPDRPWRRTAVSEGWLTTRSDHDRPADWVAQARAQQHAGAAGDLLDRADLRAPRGTPGAASDFRLLPAVFANGAAQHQALPARRAIGPQGRMARRLQAAACFRVDGAGPGVFPARAAGPVRRRDLGQRAGRGRGAGRPRRLHARGPCRQLRGAGRVQAQEPGRAPPARRDADVPGQRAPDQRPSSTRSALPEMRPHVIALGRAHSMLALRDWLDTGGMAGLLADRTLPGRTAIRAGSAATTSRCRSWARRPSSTTGRSGSPCCCAGRCTSWPASTWAVPATMSVSSRWPISASACPIRSRGNAGSAPRSKPM